MLGVFRGSICILRPTVPNNLLMCKKKSGFALITNPQLVKNSLFEPSNLRTLGQPIHTRFLNISKKTLRSPSRPQAHFIHSVPLTSQDPWVPVDRVSTLGFLLLLNCGGNDAWFSGFHFRRVPFFVVKERVVHAPVLNHRILPTFYINTTNIYIVLRSMVIPYSISNCAAYT